MPVIDDLLQTFARIKQDHAVVESDLRKLVASLNTQLQKSLLGYQKVTVTGPMGELQWHASSGISFRQVTNNGQSSNLTKLQELSADVFFTAMELLPALITQIVVSERVKISAGRETLAISTMMLQYLTSPISSPQPVNPDAPTTDPAKDGRFGMIG